MSYELTWWPEADTAMDELERDPSKAAVLAAVDRTLIRLAADPHHQPGTVPFRRDELGGVYATPVRVDRWYVLWHRGPEPDIREIEIVFIRRLPNG